MFVGHYGVSFALKSVDKHVPLWLLFTAVQFVDVLWAILILAGIEKVRITPGIVTPRAAEKSRAISAATVPNVSPRLC